MESVEGKRINIDGHDGSSHGKIDFFRFRAHS